MTRKVGASGNGSRLHQSLPGIAFALAFCAGDRDIHTGDRRSEPGDPRDAAAYRAQFLLGNCSIRGFLGNITYGLFALGEADIPPNAVTDAPAACLSSLLKPDGSWEGGDIRPTARRAKSDCVQSACHPKRSPLRFAGRGFQTARPCLVRCAIRRNLGSADAPTGAAGRCRRMEPKTGTRG